MSNKPSLILRQAVLDGIAALRHAANEHSDRLDSTEYTDGFSAGFEAALRAVEVGLGGGNGTKKTYLQEMR